MAATSVALLVLAGSAGATFAAGPTVSADGYADTFGPPFGRVEGGTVRVVGQPGLTATTGTDGSWHIDGLTVGDQVSFELIVPGRPVTQTKVFDVPVGGLTDVTFQSPTQQLFDGFAGVLGVTPDPANCTVAATVTRRGFVYGTWPYSTHGEPGATVSMVPAPAAPPADGPVYFNLVTGSLIWPDRALTETTADGGVVWANVPPGTYTLHAAKAGAVIPDVTVECRPGVLVNAAPPYGLQVTEGGTDPSVDPFVPTTTTASTSSTTSTTTSSASAPVAAVPAFTG